MFNFPHRYQYLYLSTGKGFVIVNDQMIVTFLIVGILVLFFVANSNSSFYGGSSLTHSLTQSVMKMMIVMMITMTSNKGSKQDDN